jgi:O-antigen/teichoic acid export membrane protein
MAHRLVKQTVLLSSAQVFGMLVGFLSNMILAKWMGAQEFGVYAFAVSVLSFTALFFEFGYFASGARLLAENHDEEREKELTGTILVVFGVISLAFNLTIYVLAVFVDRFLEVKVGNSLHNISLIAFVFIVPFFLELILKGSNRIELLSYFNFVWKVAFIGGVFLLMEMRLLTSNSAVMLFSISCVLPFLLLLFYLKPSFSNLVNNLSLLQAENKRYGIHLFLGRIVDTGTYNMDSIIISMFHSVEQIGYYSIAFSMARPISVFSRSMAMAKFRDFLGQSEISRQIIMINMILILLGGLSSTILGYCIIIFYLGPQYHNCIMLLPILVLTVGFQAAYQPYNAWLCSNGLSKALKRKSLYTALSNLVLNFTLIPKWGALGAAVASLLSMMHSYYLHVYYYRKGKQVVCRASEEQSMGAAAIPACARE